MLKLYFFLSLFIILYVYMGYPVAVFFIALIQKKTIAKSCQTPFVTILIAAYNEEDSIEKTLENKLALDYPEDKFEIIVISDESTDKTEDIVNGFPSHRVRLIRQALRAGKTSALNLAVPQASGDILVFSDANSLYEQDALKKLVQNFQDPTVGYVTGKMIYTNPDGSPIGDGCSAYMKYENWLRAFETKVGSVVGVDGGVDAVRKKLYQPMNPDQLPDFVLPLKVIDQGYRVIYEPEAILKEPSLKPPEDEYKMRVRVSLRALWGIYDMRHLLTFSQSKLFSWQLWSHKVLRYLCFIFLGVAYLSNLLLWSCGPFYQSFFILQTLAYAGAALSPALERKGFCSRLLYFLHYFVLLNIASAHAFVKFMFRQKQVIWTPRKG
jgi:cellulose synthase/poly-beta-1,6-N-acetylglucosamine synthase-like glycosyltransferase